MHLFDDLDRAESWQEPLGPGAVALRRFAASNDRALMTALEDVVAQAPSRAIITNWLVTPHQSDLPQSRGKAGLSAAGVGG